MVHKMTELRWIIVNGSFLIRQILDGISAESWITHSIRKVIVEKLEIGQHLLYITSSDDFWLFLACENITAFRTFVKNGWCSLDLQVDIHLNHLAHKILDMALVGRNLVCDLGEGEIVLIK